MKNLLNLIFIFLCLVIISCKERTQTNQDECRVDSIWALPDMWDVNYNILSDTAQWLNGDRFLKKNTKYNQLTSQQMENTNTLVNSYLEKNKRLLNIPFKSPVIKYYNRQYLCYIDNGEMHVFVNLYAFSTIKYDYNRDLRLSDDCRYKIINPLSNNEKYFISLLVNLSRGSVDKYAIPIQDK